MLTSIERDPSQDERAPADVVNTHPIALGEECTVSSSPLSRNSSIDVNLKPSFDLRWIMSELNVKFACELYVFLSSCSLNPVLTFRPSSCTDIMWANKSRTTRNAS